MSCRQDGLHRTAVQELPGFAPPAAAGAIESRNAYLLARKLAVGTSANTAQDSSDRSRVHGSSPVPKSLELAFVPARHPAFRFFLLIPQFEGLAKRSGIVSYCAPAVLNGERSQSGAA